MVITGVNNNVNELFTGVNDTGDKFVDTVFAKKNLFSRKLGL